MKFKFFAIFYLSIWFPSAEPDLPRIYMSGTWNLGKLVGKGNLKQGSQLYEGTFENVLDCENIVDLIISKATLYL